MSRNYKFHNPDGLYFVSFAVVYWLDVFTRKQYIEILIESLKFCQKDKGMEIFAWCIMTNHVHLVFRIVTDDKPEQVIGDLKRFTSKKIVNAIINNPNESQKEFFLNMFIEAGKKSSNVNKYQFWQHNNHPIEISDNKTMDIKINYVHNNPVKAGYVILPEDYPYSSAKDYCGEIGLLPDIVVEH
jgi:REP element-mobilizing transposase RayT